MEVHRELEPACPNCGSLRVVRLARSTPPSAPFDKAEIGRSVIEGRRMPDTAFHYCQDCHRQFEVRRRRHA